MNIFVFGALFGVLTGIVIATFFMMKIITKSNDLGDTVGSFWDYGGKLNVVEEVKDLDEDHLYVDAMKIFNEHLEERKAAEEAKKTAEEARKAR